MRGMRGHKPWDSWYCVEFYRTGPARVFDEGSRTWYTAPGEWISGVSNPRGMCYGDRADAKVAAADMAADQNVRTRVRRVTPFCQCYLGNVRVDEIGAGTTRGREFGGRRTSRRV
jgi:hypothetical protein